LRRQPLSRCDRDHGVSGGGLRPDDDTTTRRQRRCDLAGVLRPSVCWSCAGYSVKYQRLWPLAALRPPGRSRRSEGRSDHKQPMRTDAACDRVDPHSCTARSAAPPAGPIRRRDSQKLFVVSSCRPRPKAAEGRAAPEAPWQAAGPRTPRRFQRHPEREARGEL